MGDSYRPGRPPKYPSRGANHHDYDDREVRQNAYSWHEPSSHQESRYDSRHQTYHDERRDYYPPRDQEFSFRGAARGEYRLPQEDFTFRAPGPPAPHFTPINRFDAGAPRQAKNRRGQAPHSESHRPHPVRTDRREGFAQRGRVPFSKKPAHTRDILNRDQREATPEQLKGMNADAQPRFRDVDDASAADLSDEPSVGDDADSESDAAPRKRLRTEDNAAPAAPKWSNPDPYTSLPPPEASSGPKRDIVQVIRQAKVENAPQNDGNTAVRQNDDFISLTFDNDPPPPTHHSFQQDRPSGTTNSSENARPIEGDSFARASKRKRPPPRKDDDILPAWQLLYGEDHTPWCTVDHSETADTGLRLHKEICDFYDFVRAHDHESAARLALIRRVKDAINGWSQLKGQKVDLQSFGSFAAGLYLPVADMDLVAISPTFTKRGVPTLCQTKNKIMALAHHLERSGIVQPGTMAPVPRARVPIIKFADRITGIRVDISFENLSGIHANKTFQEWKDRYPAMPAIVVLIKQLLAMRGLNEVHTGGIGGFTIICLVVSMMQRLPQIQSNAMDGRVHYGDLLLNFLDLYGNKFDLRRTGIKMQPPEYFDKTKVNLTKSLPDRLTIIDPNDANNDISGGSRSVESVFRVFGKAHSMVQRRLADLYEGRNLSGSILGCVLSGNYETFAAQREVLTQLYHGSNQFRRS